MVKIFKNTAAFVGTVILICMAISAIALTVEFVAWLFDLHYSGM